MSSPIEWIADEASRRGVDVTEGARWFLLGYHVGRETGKDPTLLGNEAAMRGLVATMVGQAVGQVKSDPPPPVSSP